MTIDVVTLGESLVSFVAEEAGRVDTVAHFRKRVGGAEMNTAIGLARLGASVAWISRLGADPFGDEIVRALRGEGVHTGAVVRDAAAPTGLMVKEFRAGGVTHVHYCRTGLGGGGAVGGRRRRGAGGRRSARPPHRHHARAGRRPGGGTCCGGGCFTTGTTIGVDRGFLSTGL